MKHKVNEVNLGEIGRIGEAFAAKYLTKRGFLIICRNKSYQNIGEIDIIAVKNGIFHFIEVKSSSKYTISSEFHPICHFDKIKKEKLRAAMIMFSREKKIMEIPRQLDLIGVYISRETLTTEVFHQENIYFEEY